MSAENVEIVRRFYDAWKRRDMGALQALTGPDIRIDMSDRIFNPATYHGREGLQRFIAEIRDVWSEFEIEPEEILDQNDKVVVFIRTTGRGKVSGVPVSVRSAFLVGVRGGKIYSLRLYRDRARALEAVGLEV